MTYDATKKTLTLLTTKDMTDKPGHKEIVLTVSSTVAGKLTTKQILLPFDVTRR